MIPGSIPAAPQWLGLEIGWRRLSSRLDARRGIHRCVDGGHIRRGG